MPSNYDHLRGALSLNLAGSSADDLISPVSMDDWVLFAACGVKKVGFWDDPVFADS